MDFFLKSFAGTENVGKAFKIIFKNYFFIFFPVFLTQHIIYFKDVFLINLYACCLYGIWDDPFIAIKWHAPH